MASQAKDLKRFTIFFQGRSGSTYLAEALDSHPQVRCEEERLVGLRRHGAAAQLSWLEQFFADGERHNLAAIGFKTKLDDILDQQSVADLLRRIDARVILLSRRNVVKMVVSWFNSERLYEATGEWNQYPPGMRMSPLAIDSEKFDRRLGLVLHGKARLEEYVRSLKLRKLHIFYEDLLTDQRYTLQRVCDFLDVESLSLQGQCIKSTSDDLRKAIANFDDLHALYRGTYYQQMLEEVLVPSQSGSA